MANKDEKKTIWENPRHVTNRQARDVSEALLRGSLLRQKVADGWALGTFLIELPSPEAVTSIALAGFDFVVLDMEHSATDFSRLETLILAAHAAGLVALAAQSDRPVRFVFFPMNPIQLGGSDLNAAWRLHTLLAGKVDFRVLEADPDVDGVLYLLRHLDAALTMRFHGSIFSLSQGLGTVGVDYYPGQGGKVEQLFTDQGTPDRVRRMDEVTADWVTGSLAALLAHAPGKAAQ